MMSNDSSTSQPVFSALGGFGAGPLAQDPGGKPPCGANTTWKLDAVGMAVAPANFGKFSNALLVGEFNLGVGSMNPPNGGPGYILAFSLAPGAANGAFLGVLEGTNAQPLSIDGLWSLIFGNNGSGGNPNNLYFSAGINGQSDGLFGSLSACHGRAISNASARSSTV
jgi:hypothetical protein